MPTDDCQVCGGLRSIRLFFLTEKLESVVHGVKFKTDAGGQMWRFREGTYLCPKCGVKSGSMDAAIEGSGLQPEDLQIEMHTYAQDPNRSEAVDLALRYALRLPDTSGFAGIFGALGVGKTTLAKGVVAKALRLGLRARIISAKRLITEIRATYKPYSKRTAADIIDEFVAYPVLVIDEFDVLDQTDDAQMTFREVLNQRYEARRHYMTMLLSNADPSNLGEAWKYAEDRLKDGDLVIMGGRSLRGLFEENGK
jgi:hypothetical protein